MILALLLAGNEGWCQSSRAKLLAQLTQLPNIQLSPKVDAAIEASREDVRLLGLDLIVYRWAARAAGSTPDVKNIDTIIRVINRQTGDPMLQWAETVFPAAGKAMRSGAPPPSNDKNGPLIQGLLTRFDTALQYKDSRPVDSISALKSVLESCLELKLELAYAQALGELGDRYFYDTAQFQDADNCYTDAIWIFGTAYKCTAASAKLLDSYGLLNNTLGRYAVATDNHEQAAKQWLHLAEQDPSGHLYRDEAGLQYIKAGKALMSGGEAARGLKIMTEQALPQLQTWAYSVKKYRTLIDTRMNIAELYRAREETDSAIGQLKAALKDSEAYGDPLLKARTYQELAKTYAVAGSTSDVAEMNRMARLVLNATTVAGDSAISILKQNLNLTEARKTDLLIKAKRGAAAHKELGNLPQAEYIWKELAVVFHKLALLDDRIDALQSLASIYEDRQKREESVVIRVEAAMLAFKAGKINLAVAIVEDTVRTYNDMGDVNGALEGFQELAPIIFASGDERRAAQIDETAGDLLVANNQPGDAIEYLQKARTRYLNSVGDAWASARVSIKLAVAQVDAGRPNEARSTLEAAKRNVENLAASADVARNEIIRTIYRDLACLDIIAGKTEDAELLLKRAVRYIWQPDLIREMKTNSNAAIAQFALQFASRVQLISATDPNIIGPNESKRQMLLANNWGAFSDACWVLRRARSAAAYNALPINPLDIYAVRTKLPKDVAIVTYLFTDSAAYAFICTLERASCWKLVSTALDATQPALEFWGQIQTYENRLRSGIPIPPVDSLDNPAVANVRKPLTSLYDMLIEPIKDDISGKRLLVFALPNEIAGLPMHALINNQRSAGPRYLIQDYEVSYLSEGMLPGFINREAGIINPSTDRLTMLADPEGNLPGARAEAKAVGEIYAYSKSYVGEEATVARFVSEGATAGILHVAAHQRINPSPGTGFTLLLAPDNTSGGNLSLQDLTGLHSDKLKMVVLSACDSLASSDPASYGASRAAEIFTYAGAKSVMGTLWKISDQATGTLTTGFYRQITTRATKSKSLQTAQIRMIESGDLAHPFYWAAFALHGNPW